MADAITGTTELVATKQDLVSQLVQKELREAVTLLPTISDFSAMAVPGAKQLNIPKLDAFTVIDRVSAAAGDATVLTSSTDDLALDKNAFVSWIIDSFDEIQSNINAQLEFARRAASAQGRYVDAQIVTEMETVGEATTTAGTISRDIVLEMRETLLTRNANKDQLFLAVPPAQEAALLKIAEFSSSDVYGAAVIPSGFIGRVFGVNLVLNNQLGATQYFMYDKDGIAIAFQQRPNMASESDIKYGSKAMRFVLDQIFGLKGMQLGVNGVGGTESALVVKDNNV